MKTDEGEAGEAIASIVRHVAIQQIRHDGERAAAQIYVLQNHFFHCVRHVRQR